jgi:hypothetical protein
MQLRVPVQKDGFVEEVRESLIKGESQKSIAFRLGVSTSTISRINTGATWQGSYNPSQRRQGRVLDKKNKWNNPIDSSEIDFIVNAYDCGKSSHDVANLVGRSKTSVLRVLRQAGVAIRTQSETKRINGLTLNQIEARKKPKGEAFSKRMSEVHKGKECPYAGFQCKEPDRKDVLYFVVYHKDGKDYLKIGRSFSGAKYHIKQTGRLIIVSILKEWEGRSAWVWEVEKAVKDGFKTYRTSDRFKHSTECFNLDLDASVVIDFVDNIYQAREQR